MLKTAQELIVIDPTSFHENGGYHGHAGVGDNMIPIVPLEVSMPPEEHEEHVHENGLEVTDGDHEIVIELSDLPGAPHGTQDPQEEPELEVTEDTSKDKDENDAKKSKKNEKWDWEAKGPHGFVAWIKERVSDVPAHSGYDSSGLQRAIAYLEKVDAEISKAMRLDLDGELDADKIEEVRSKIDDGLARLNSRLDKVNKTSKSRRKKKSEYEETGLVKEGQKITGVQGTFVTVPLLISGIGRVCINGMVSGGHDIEHIYKDQVAKFKLNARERAEVRWFLYDLGYQMRGDRGFMPDEDIDVSNNDNYDWAANYKA